MDVWPNLDLRHLASDQDFQGSNPCASVCRSILADGFRVHSAGQEKQQPQTGMMKSLFSVQTVATQKLSVVTFKYL